MRIEDRLGLIKLCPGHNKFRFRERNDDTMHRLVLDVYIDPNDGAVMVDLKSRYRDQNYKKITRLRDVLLTISPESKQVGWQMREGTSTAILDGTIKPQSTSELVWCGLHNENHNEYKNVIEEKESAEELRTKLMPIIEKYKISSLYLFGSRARGDNQPDSDYDFLIESVGVRTLWDLKRLEDDLVGALHQNISLLTPNMVKDDFFLLKGLREDGMHIYGNSLAHLW